MKIGKDFDFDFVPEEIVDGLITISNGEKNKTKQENYVPKYSELAISVYYSLW